MENKYIGAIKGLRLLKKANILSIIAIILAIIGGMALVIGAGIGVGMATESGGDLSAGAAGAAGSGVIIAMIGLVLSLAAGIMKIVALLKAMPSHAGYKNALIVVGVEIAISILTVALKSMPAIITQIMPAVSTVITFVVVYFVIQATVALLNEKGSQAVAEKGMAVSKLYMICTAIAVLCTVLGLIPMLAGVVGIISFATSVVQLVALFRFIGFLGHAASALEA